MAGDGESDQALGCPRRGFRRVLPTLGIFFCDIVGSDTAHVFALEQETPLSAIAVREVLAQEGFLLPRPKFSPPESDANRQASPTESATRGRSFRHPLPQAICGSGTRLTATRQSIVDFKSKVKYYFSLDVVVVGPCGLRE